MAQVDIKQLTKVYSNGFQAVTDIDLKVTESELMVLHKSRGGSGNRGPELTKMPQISSLAVSLSKEA